MLFCCVETIISLLGFNYSAPAFETAVNFFAPTSEDVMLLSGSGDVRVTLRWPAIPTTVVDINGSPVGQSVRIKIYCMVSNCYSTSIMETVKKSHCVSVCSILVCFKECCSIS